MASSDDEIRKRQMLLDAMSAAGTEVLFQNEMAQPNAPVSQARVNMATGLGNARLMGNQALALRQKAADLQAPAMIPARQDFLTPSGKGGVMDFVKGILSQRLQSKGLRRDPLDIARQNAVNRQSFDAQQSALARQAENAQSLSDLYRQRAVRQALQSGENVDPRLALSGGDFFQNQIKTQGLDLDPIQQLNLASKGTGMQGADALRTKTRDLFQRGLITESAAQSVINAEDGRVSEEFAKLRTPVQLAPGIMGSRSIVDPADVQMADDITSDDLRDAKVLGFRRGKTERELDLKARETITKFVTEIEPKIAGNEQIFQEIMPKVFNAVLENDTLFSGPLNVFLSDSAKAVLDPEGANVQELAATIAQQSLRELLGDQFAVQENIQLINRFYNRNLPPLFNLARLRRSQQIGQSILKMNRALKERMETEGTLFSADGKNNFKYPTLEDVFASEGYGQDGLGDLLSALTDDDIRALKNKKLSGEYQGKSVQSLLSDEIRRRTAQ